MTRLRAPAWRAAISAAVVLLVAACSSDEQDAYQEQPVDSIYNAAMELLLDKNYEAAAKQFEEVERQHPYSIWAAKAQVMSAYSYFRRDRYDESINAANRFIQLHPTSPDAPYAYYLKSLAYYEQIVDIGRDQRTTARALDALEDVIRRYPETQYARDASLKLDLTRDHLAGKEMSVGRFYLKRGELVAAINRFKRVVERHQTTSHVPEALLRLSEAYTALGLTNEARRMTAILGHNYPGSPWYADAYELVEDVEVANFPRPDDRAFYDRWFDPDSTIAKAERSDVPGIAPGAQSARATEVADGSAAARVQPAASRATLGDAPAASGQDTAAAEAAEPTRATAEAGENKGFFGSIASAIGGLVSGEDDAPEPKPAEVAAAPPAPEPSRGEERAVERAPIQQAEAPPTAPEPAPVASRPTETGETEAKDGDTDGEAGVFGSIASTFGSIFSSDEPETPQPTESVAAAPQLAPQAEPAREAPVERAPAPIAAQPAPRDPAPREPEPRELAPRDLPPREPAPNLQAQANEQPQGPRPWQLETSERAALVAEAESQTLAAKEAAGEWRRAQAAASSDDGRRRAQANVALSDAAAGYWEARGAVVRANTDEEVRKAELLLAQESVVYWTAARNAAEDDLARSHASAALSQAQQVLDYWRRTGRRPTWLERTFGTSI